MAQTVPKVEIFSNQQLQAVSEVEIFSNQQPFPILQTVIDCNQCLLFRPVRLKLPNTP